MRTANFLASVVVLTLSMGCDQDAPGTPTAMSDTGAAVGLDAGPDCLELGLCGDALAAEGQPLVLDEFLVRIVREYCVACATSAWDYVCAQQNPLEVDALNGCTYDPVMAEVCLEEPWTCDESSSPEVVPKGGPACDLVFDCS